MDLDHLSWSRYIQLHRFIPSQRGNLIKIHLIAVTQVSVIICTIIKCNLEFCEFLWTNEFVSDFKLNKLPVAISVNGGYRELAPWRGWKGAAPLAYENCVLCKLNMHNLRSFLVLIYQNILSLVVARGQLVFL